MRNEPVNNQMAGVDCGYMPDDAKIKELRKVIIKEFLYQNVMQEKQPLKAFLCDIEKQVIEYSLFLTQGNQKVAAQLIGLNPTTFFEKMKKHGIVYIPSNNARDYTKSYREMILLSIENQNNMKSRAPL